MQLGAGKSFQLEAGSLWLGFPHLLQFVALPWLNELWWEVNLLPGLSVLVLHLL